MFVSGYLFAYTLDYHKYIRQLSKVSLEVFIDIILKTLDGSKNKLFLLLFNENNHIATKFSAKSESVLQGLKLNASKSKFINIVLPLPKPRKGSRIGGGEVKIG